MNKVIDRLRNPRATVRTIWYKYRWIVHRCLEWMFGKRIKDYKDVPIIINNYNQLTYLKSLLDALEKRGYTNIHILDNASSYPPLIEFYAQCRYPVYKLAKNIGYKALWETDIFKKFRRSYYVYTDPDVVPIDECPPNFIEYFFDLLGKYKKAQKVGFSLKTDDLPDCFHSKEKVINWEQKILRKTVGENVYDAPIDTTFALYRPFSSGEANFVELNLRTGFPYQARHLPWYSDSDNLTDEQKYYISKCKTITHWSEQMKK